MIFGSIQILLFLRRDVARPEASDLDLTVVALLGFSFGLTSAGGSARLQLGSASASATRERRKVTC
jgi:predicted dienelactone hydrolase